MRQEAHLCNVYEPLQEAMAPSYSPLAPSAHACFSTESRGACVSDRASCNTQSAVQILQDAGGVQPFDGSSRAAPSGSATPTSQAEVVRWLEEAEPELAAIRELVSGAFPVVCSRTNFVQCFSEVNLAKLARNLRTGTMLGTKSACQAWLMFAGHDCIGRALRALPRGQMERMLLPYQSLSPL